MFNIIRMKIKILKAQMWGIRELTKIKFGYPVKGGIKRNTTSMNELSVILGALLRNIY
jgi:hypothetical protein